MKITIEKDGITVVIEAIAELATDVIEELVAPALIAYGWHPESIAAAMRDYAAEHGNEDRA